MNFYWISSISNNFRLFTQISGWKLVDESSMILNYRCHEGLWNLDRIALDPWLEDAILEPDLQLVTNHDNYITC